LISEVPQRDICETALSEDTEKIRRLVGFKKRLEQKIEDLTTELKDTQAMLETLDSLLIQKGFKRLEVNEKPNAVQNKPVTENPNIGESHSINEETVSVSEEKTELQAKTGELLATLYTGENSLRVVLAEDKAFNINTPPFTHFLVERVLLKMQERDSELVRARQLSPENVFCYSIVRDDDKIKEIDIRNTDPMRTGELKSSIRWTLEKMYEKSTGRN
jgi:hypothetical protein